MFLSVCVIAGAVCDIEGKKGGDACLQEKTPETRIFRDRAHSSSQEGRRGGHSVKIVPTKSYLGLCTVMHNHNSHF